MIHQINAQNSNTTSTNTTSTNTTNSTTTNTTNTTTNGTTNTTKTNTTANTSATNTTVKKVVINRNILVNFTQNEIKTCIEQDCLPFTNKCTNTTNSTSNCTGNLTTYNQCFTNITACNYTQGSTSVLLSPNCPQSCNATIYQNYTNATSITVINNETANLTTIAQCYSYCYGFYQYNTYSLYKYVNESAQTNQTHAQYLQLVQKVIDEGNYNASLKSSSTKPTLTPSGFKIGMFAFPLQRQEDLTSTKEKRLAIGAAVIIVYMFHYLFVGLVNFLPKEKINKNYFEQIERFLYLFGFAALLSANWLQTGLFDALLCYFTFVFVIALHLPVLLTLGLETMWQKIGKYMWLGYIGLICIWFWGIIIGYYHYWLDHA